VVDRALIERAQHGDRDAYEALARSSARRLYATAYRITRDPDRADDAVQQTLVAMWRELPSLRDPDRFEAWTYRLVVRACLAERRRDQRRGVRMIPIAEMPILTDDDTAALDLRDQLDRAIRDLSIEHRTVLVLHLYVGLPLTEIAEILGVPAGTVRSRLHHAKRSVQAAVVAAERSPLIGGQPA
jgi:RNA polymerase sigma-70 factor (ECF subfamily)